MSQKVLLVGDPRICPQVAYVMDWQNFEQVEQLTDVEKYRDYKIVICAFKRKSKKYTPVGGGAKYTYLDDICRELDAEEQRTPLSPDMLADKPIPLWRRVIERIKTGEVGLAIIRRLKHHVILRNFRIINKLPVGTLRLSELFIKVLYSKPSKVACNVLEATCFIDPSGDVAGCCYHRPYHYLLLGNVKENGLAAVYNSYRGRIIRLSSINKSLCLCKLQSCNYPSNIATNNNGSTKFPMRIELALDQSCNLVCPSCRKTRIAETLPDYKQNLLNNIDESSMINKVSNLRMAGCGEVFYSKLDLYLLQNVLQREQIQILSNGTLFDKKRWQIIEDKYKIIDVLISIDAASAATYRKLRGGDFEQLMKNLEMLGGLRSNGKIRYFALNFVVQKDNYLEMADFVRLAKKVHADTVNFRNLQNWNTYSKREYRKKSLIIHQRRLHRDLQRILCDPIFQDPIVDLLAFSRYIKNFKQKFPQSLQPKLSYEWF